MTPGLNKVMIIGRLGREPEMRYTPSGKPITSFSVGTTRSWMASGGKQISEIEWFNVVAWNNLAENCKQSLSKNSLVYIDGRLQTRNWEDSSGNRHSKTEIVANEMIMLEERRDTTGSPTKSGNENG